MKKIILMLSVASFLGLASCAHHGGHHGGKDCCCGKDSCDMKGKDDSCEMKGSKTEQKDAKKEEKK